MAGKQTLYDFLNKSVKILIVDDCDKILHVYKENLSRCPLYDVYCVNSASEAKKLLDKDLKFHVCIEELGIADIENDEFYLIKNYSQICTFLIATKTFSAQKEFLAHCHGAKKLFHKPVQFRNTSFIHEINRAFLNNLITPKNNYVENEMVVNARSFLIDNDPDDIMEWAAGMGISEECLENLWSKAFATKPRHHFLLYKLFSRALSFYEDIFNGIQRDLSGKDGAEDISEYKEFYYNSCTS